jgi:hypothetical protein
LGANAKVLLGVGLPKPYGCDAVEVKGLADPKLLVGVEPPRPEANAVVTDANVLEGLFAEGSGPVGVLAELPRPGADA